MNVHPDPVGKLHLGPAHLGLLAGAFSDMKVRVELRRPEGPPPEWGEESEEQ